jgi:hypothetical protein
MNGWSSLQDAWEGLRCFCVHVGCEVSLIQLLSCNACRCACVTEITQRMYYYLPPAVATLHCVGPVSVIFEEACAACTNMQVACLASIQSSASRDPHVCTCSVLSQLTIFFTEDTSIHTVLYVNKACCSQLAFQYALGPYFRSPEWCCALDSHVRVWHCYTACTFTEFV